MILKNILFFILFVSSFYSLFAFEVLNSDLEPQEFFSFSKPDVFIQVNTQYEFFSVSNGNLTKTYNLIQCQNKFCGNFSITDFIQENEDSFTGKKYLDISLGEVRRIEIDIENPTIRNITSSINSEQKKINFTFTYQDNYNSIKRAEILEIINNSRIFIANILDKNEVEIDINSSGNKTFVFILEDEAGNILEEIQTILIEDILPPKLLSGIILRENNKIYLSFSVEDETNLESYIIKQNSIELKENLSGKIFSKKILLPFTQSTISFIVSDNLGNLLEKEFSLVSPFNFLNVKKFSNKKKFSFEEKVSNSCQLHLINGKEIKRNFTKTGNKFEVDLEISSEGSKKVEFSCRKDEFEERVVKDFVYDKSPPKKVKLSAKANEAGRIELLWDKSSDNLEFYYELYRDNKKIYHGQELSYLDKKVDFPNSYKYKLKILDEAKNEVTTNIVKITPKKTSVKFSSSLKNKEEVTLQNFTFSVQAEQDSEIEIKHYSEDELKEKILRERKKEKEEFSLKLFEGKNKIKISVEDDFGNLRSETIEIIYTKEGIIVTEEIEKILIENIETKNVEEKENGFSIFLWVLIIILPLLLLLVAFFKEEFSSIIRAKVHTHKAILKRENSERKTFGSSIDKIKEKRIKNQNERKKQAEVQEKLNLFVKKKYAENNKKKEIDFSFNKKRKSKKSFSSWISKFLISEERYNEGKDGRSEENSEKKEKRISKNKEKIKDLDFYLQKRKHSKK